MRVPPVDGRDRPGSITRIDQGEPIPKYSMLDHDARLVESWKPDEERPAVIAEVLRWQPMNDVPALEINLPELFAGALD